VCSPSCALAGTHENHADGPRMLDRPTETGLSDRLSAAKPIRVVPTMRDPRPSNPPLEGTSFLSLRPVITTQPTRSRPASALHDVRPIGRASSISRL
jgi:hypothetical protein